MIRHTVLVRPDFAAAIAAALLVSCSISSSEAAPITPGNLVIFRAGSGTNSLSSTTGNDVILDERTPAGSLVQSIAITATGAGTKLITAGGFFTGTLRTAAAAGFCRFLFAAGARTCTETGGERARRLTVGMAIGGGDDNMGDMAVGGARRTGA